MIGIYGVSTKSGKAFLADLLGMGIEVYGYGRASEHGREVVDALNDQGGILLERPESTTEATSRFLGLAGSEVGHDLQRLVERSDVILIAHPSIYHEETAQLLGDAGLGGRHRIPLILSPSRTLATPYVWQILGEQYPIVSFSTCPYSCKSYSAGVTYIKRRKKSWVASMEGEVGEKALTELQNLFPQMLVSRIPATTSLGNMGAVFHPGPYLLNLEAIKAAEEKNAEFSFYVEGIANNPEAGKVIGEIDQIRLHIARAVGCSVFGLDEEPREVEWSAIIAKVAGLAEASATNMTHLRRQRAACLQPIRDSVVSGQHWLDYTYGTKRIPGESLSHAIGRTPTFIARSYPQERYIDEDIPTGLVPMESLAERLGIPHEPISRVVDLYKEVTRRDARQTGRNLGPFETEYLKGFLSGRLARKGTGQ